MKDKNDLFWQLLETEHSKAESFCRKLTANLEDGKDLYQQAVLAALRKFAGLRDKNAFKPWFYKILVNTCRSDFRKRKRQMPILENAFEPYAGSDPSDEYNARIWLERALSVLSPGDRALVVLYEIEGWSISEISKVERMPEGTIKSRLFRARRKMRDAIAQNLPRAKKKIEVSGYELSQGQTGNIEG